MCTVTYIPCNNGYYLTSNRDENKNRATSISPLRYTLNEENLIFPKDAEAGGTWIVLKENGDALCLLNGAFKKFVPSNLHTVSRGKIVLQIASAYSMIDEFKKSDLKNTAPFTLVMVQQLILIECRWDGQNKKIKYLNANKHYIWSSCTLYNTHQQLCKENQFEKWLQKNNSTNLKEILSFHNQVEFENLENNLVFNKNETYLTVSTTSVVVNNLNTLMHHIDLKNEVISTYSFATYAASF
jgi:Transport and Golgi organisation 2